MSGSAEGRKSVCCLGNSAGSLFCALSLNGFGVGVVVVVVGDVGEEVGVDGIGVYFVESTCGGGLEKETVGGM